MSDKVFHWLDYLVFVLTLVISAAIGIYYGFTGRRQSTTSDFFVGNKQLSCLPVALSLQASFLSAIFVLGTPAEVYCYGTLYSLIGLSYFIGNPLAAELFLPIFHKLDLTSAYEYLERRYNFLIRLMGSLTFTLMMIFYLALVLYAPAIAFSQVTGLSMWLSILGIGLICTFYTALGGIKAVVWTDAFQMCVILAGLVTLLILGTTRVGGFQLVFDLANNGSRIQFNNFSADPFTRHTFWSQLIGGATITLTLYGANQAMIQRYISIEKKAQAKLSVYIAMVSTFVFLVLVSLLGIVVYAYYYSCDPLSTGQISSKDQIIPYFLMDVSGSMHGLPGLFTASAFSAALSSVSSGVNSLAAVTLEDIICPLYSRYKTKQMKDTTATKISKVLAISFGFLTIFLGYLASLLGRTVLQIALSVFGMLGGPLLGLICIAIFLPCSNAWGAGAGLLSSLVCSCCLTIGSVFSGRRTEMLPMRTDGCMLNSSLSYNTSSQYLGNNYSVSHSHNLTLNSSVLQSPVTYFQFSDLYQISYMWYSTIAVLVAFIVGLLVSLISGGTHKQSVDPELIYTLPKGCPRFAAGSFNCNCCASSNKKNQSFQKKEHMELAEADNYANCVYKKTKQSEVAT